MIRGLQNLRIAMDARLLGGHGQGASTYAAALRRAQLQIASNALLLSDDSCDGHPRGRLLRWLHALSPLAVRAREQASAAGPILFAPDIFRLAQVWFDIHHRLMPIRVSGPPGIMHWSYPVPLRIRGWKNIYTVHDAIPLVQPRLTGIAPERHRLLLTRMVEQTGRGGALVTVSEAARAEIAGALNLDPASITDCGLAVDRRDDLNVRLPGKLVPRDYLLVCGTVEPRKNSLVIAEAYRRSGVRMPLVFAGPPGELDRHPMIARTSGIIRITNPDHATMTALIGRACALLMPSRAEGFGLPVAEAMTLGTPVLTSGAGALAETAGDGALLVDPADVAGLAAAIVRLVGDPALRATLVASGHTNAARFTPARFASRLAAFYATLVAEQK